MRKFFTYGIVSISLLALLSFDKVFADNPICAPRNLVTKDSDALDSVQIAWDTPANSKDLPCVLPSKTIKTYRVYRARYTTEGEMLPKSLYGLPGTLTNSTLVLTPNTQYDVTVESMYEDGSVSPPATLSRLAIVDLSQRCSAVSYSAIPLNDSGDVELTWDELCNEGATRPTGYRVWVDSGDGSTGSFVLFVPEEGKRYVARVKLAPGTSYISRIYAKYANSVPEYATANIVTGGSKASVAVVSSSSPAKTIIYNTSNVAKVNNNFTSQPVSKTFVTKQNPLALSVVNRNLTTSGVVLHWNTPTLSNYRRANALKRYDLYYAEYKDDGTLLPVKLFTRLGLVNSYYVSPIKKGVFYKIILFARNSKDDTTIESVLDGVSLTEDKKVTESTEQSTVSSQTFMNSQTALTNAISISQYQTSDSSNLKTSSYMSTSPVNSTSYINTSDTQTSEYSSPSFSSQMIYARPSQVSLTASELAVTTPVGTPPSSASRTLVLIVNQQNIIVRGIVQIISPDEIMVIKTIGGSWTVRLNQQIVYKPNGKKQTISVNDYVGVEGKISTTEDHYLDATVVRNRTLFP